MIKIVGRTTDGKDVVAGVYRFFETVGLPLDIVFDELRNRNAIPSWLHFYSEAQAAGLSHDRIISKLEEAVLDCYGAEFCRVVCETLEIRHKLTLFRRNSWLAINGSRRITT